MAVLSKDGVEVARTPLAFAGTASRFRAILPVGGAGLYEVLAYAFDAESGNTGFDRATFIVRGDS